jgi:hypothetical protein
MTTLRNRFFLEGIVLGGMCGLLVGSLIAFQVGGQRASAVRQLFWMLGDREPNPVLNRQ